MRFVMIPLLLMTSILLYGQVKNDIKTNAKKVTVNYYKTLEQSKKILKEFFSVKNLDTIASYRSDLSGFIHNTIRYRFESDSINNIPDEYLFFYNFSQKGEVIKDMYLRLRSSRKKKENKIINQYQLHDLEGIKLLITGASRITRDSIERIAESNFPGKRIQIELENDYFPFDKDKKVSHYWTIRKTEDLHKDEYEFIRVELLTGEVKPYVFKIYTVN